MAMQVSLHKNDDPVIKGTKDGSYCWLVFLWELDSVTFHRQSPAKLRAMAQRLNEIADQWEPTQEIPIIKIQKAHVNAAMQSIGEPDEIDDTPDNSDVPF